MCLMYIKYNYAPSVMLLQSIYCAYSECIQLNILSTLLGDHLCKSLLFESQTSVSYNINCVIKYLNLNVSWPGTLLAETMADGTTKFLRDFCVHEITALMGPHNVGRPTLRVQALSVLKDHHRVEHHLKHGRKPMGRWKLRTT